MDDLYYTPPASEQFEELKLCAIKIWQTYDNQFGYVDEKLNKIRCIQNIGDNFMYMVAMFDYHNQIKLSGMLTGSTKKAVADRLESGGLPNRLNVFI